MAFSMAAAVHHNGRDRLCEAAAFIMVLRFGVVPLTMSMEELQPNDRRKVLWSHELLFF